MQTKYRAELAQALAAVVDAALVCQAVQAEMVTPEALEKEDKSPVTVADFASQAVVCHRLGAAFNHDPIVAEEDASALRDDDGQALTQGVCRHVRNALDDGLSDDAVLAAIDHGAAVPDEQTKRFWTLDPIDGTKGFLRGEQYAIALALIEHGQVVLGLLGCPNLPLSGQGNGEGADPQRGVLMIAERGQGTRMLPLDHATAQMQSDAGDVESLLRTTHPVQAQPIVDPAQARFCESVESDHSDQSTSAQIAHSLGITSEPYRIDSQCKYAAVARGDAQIYLRLPTKPGYREKIWDHAAGLAVTEEAGGKVSDVRGQPLEFGRGRTLDRNRGIIATTGSIHDQVVDAVRNAMQTG